MSYGKVHTSFWTDDKILGLSNEAKLLALYFLSGPHRNAIGCMRVPGGYIQGDFGWSFEGVSEALRELKTTGFITREDDTGWTVINNLLKYDPIKGDKAAIGAAKIAATVPKNSDVYAELFKRLQPILDVELKGKEGVFGYPMEAPSEGDTKPHRSPYPSLPNQNHIPRQPKGDDVAIEFQTWWEVFPCKKAKGHALKAYRLARKKVSAETLMAGAQRYAQERSGQDAKFTAHAATWLNGERWCDEAPNRETPTPRVDPEKLTQAHVWTVKMGIHGKNDPSPSQVADLVRKGHITIKQGADYCFERPETFAGKHGLEPGDNSTRETPSDKQAFCDSWGQAEESAA